MKKLYFYLSVLALVLVANVSVFGQDYCTPTYDNSCSGDGDDVNTFILNGDNSTAINDVNTGCAGTDNNYDDRTDESVDMYPTNTYAGQISSGFNSDNARIWIDFNDDGTFSDDESVAALDDVGTSNVDFSISIPMTAAAGPHRLRVRMAYGTDAEDIDPCDGYGFGETVDYTVNIIALDDCTGTPVTGTITGPASVCGGTNFTLALDGFTPANGLTLQWQSSPAGANTWIDIPGVNLSAYTTDQDAATDYRVVAVCEISDATSTSEVFSVAMNPASECYCVPSIEENYMVITNVDYAGISNETDYTWPANGYGDYTDQIANVTPTAPEELSIDVDGGYSDDYSLYAYIDWNQNGVLDDPGEVYTLTYDHSWGGTANYTANIIPPVDALPGNTRMRVLFISAYYDEGPCTEDAYLGEAEDYTVNVAALDPCTGTPDAGSVTAPTTICPNTPFELMLNLDNPASGITFQWYSSPSGEDNYTPIADATSQWYTVEDQEAATDYYCEVTCTGSSVSSNAASVTVALSSPNECYCTPAFDNSYMYITNVEFADISNETDDWDDNGYGDYTDQVADVTPTVPEALSVDVDGGNYDSYSLYAYIDWNQNGVLDDEGEVYTLVYDHSWGGVANYTMNILPPVDAVPGNTRMRIFFADYYYDYGPCTTDAYLGEVEDYTVQVATLDPCADVPETGTLSGPSSICPDHPFTLSLDGYTVAADLTYTWQESPAGANTWTDISGTAGVLYNNPGITDAMDYRVIFICNNSGESDTSNVLPVTIKPVTECYCEPFFNNTYEYITNVNIDAIDNTTGSSTNGYADYSDQVGDIMVTVPTPLSITLSQDYYTMSLFVCVDWNHNGILGDPGELTTVYTYQSDFGENTFDLTLAPPIDAVLGNTRMRILYTDAYDNDGSDLCPNDWLGDAEDYTLNVIPMPPCASVTFPDAAGAVAYPSALCESGDVYLNLASPMPYGSGITYQWQQAASESGSYTNIGPAGIMPNYVYNTNTTNWYRCQIKCDGSTVLTSDPVEVEAVIPEVPVMTDGQHCGPGPVTLSGTVGSGNLYWYEDATSFLPVAEGDTFITPPLSSDATYYVSAGASPTIDTVVGTGTATGSSYETNPFYIGYGAGWKHQYLIKPSELTAAGFLPGSTISRIGVYVTSSSPSGIFDNFSIATATTTVSSISNFVDDLTPQYSNAAYPVVNGPNMFDLSDPINWDGTSGIIVQMCFYDENAEASTANVKYGNISGTSVYANSDFDEACDDWDWGPYTTSSRPNFYLTQQGCESERVPVTAYIRDTPVVDLGPDEDVCGDANQSVTLDAGNPGSTYIWDDGSTDQTLTMTHSGTHYVTVTNEYGCVSSDTTTKGILLAPEVHLGNDTTICDGVTITLNAGGDGIIYYWNTGDTVQTIDVDITGAYSVVVTNDLDCTVSDTINVTVEGDLPTIDAVLVTNVGPYTFNFQAYNPQGAITDYTWNFGDEEPVSHEVSPTHTYQTAGDYQVTLTLNTAECGLLTFATSTHIVGVNDISADDAVLSLYPNPARDMITIENKGNYRMEELVITNAVGQVMEKQVIANGAKKYQAGLSGYASGIYSVRIKTDKGYIVRKFEVLK